MSILSKFSQITSSSLASAAVVVTGIVGCASVAGYFSQYAQPLELMSHLRVAYLLVLSLLCVFLLALKRLKISLLPLSFICVNLFAVLPYYVSSGETCQSEKSVHVRIFSANLWGGKNRNYGATLAVIRKANPDIIGFSEVTRSWSEKMESALTDYPYRVVETQHGGIALFSKFPIHDGAVLYSSSLKRPRIEANISVGNRDVKVIVAHPFVPDYRFALRNNELAEIANDAKAANEPAIVIGDLNCTPWSYYFAKLESDGGLIDSERGFGIQPSWSPKSSAAGRPRMGLPALLPIDHCLTTKDFLTLQRSVGPKIGSDHLPLNAELCLRD